MRVILFGASGMVGQGVLRECLLDPDVERVLSIGRTRTGRRHTKLQELEHKNFLDFSPIERHLTGYDACFFCLGVTSAGMTEEAYRRITYDFTLAAARVLIQTSPQMAFVYVSGTGTDSTERGRVMWARVKGATENALQTIGFRAAYSFMPGYIQPLPWHHVADRLVSRALRGNCAALPGLERTRATLRDDNRGRGTRDDQRRTTRVADADPRNA